MKKVKQAKKETGEGHIRKNNMGNYGTCWIEGGGPAEVGVVVTGI